MVGEPDTHNSQYVLTKVAHWTREDARDTRMQHGEQCPGTVEGPSDCTLCNISSPSATDLGIHFILLA